MPALIEKSESILVSNEDRASIQKFVASTEGNNASLPLEHNANLPEELKQILHTVIHAIIDGRSISISALPKEVTTTTAASLLDVSRPTVMKFIKDGKLSARKVGSHHRLDTQQVLELLDKLKQEKRDAVFKLMDIEGVEE